VNPLLFKAHPLLHRTVSLFTDPGAQDLGQVSALISIYLVLNLAWCELFRLTARITVGVTPSRPAGYLLAFPALLAYLPIVLTVWSDVLAHQFRLEDRALLLFVLLVAVQLVAALCGVLLREPADGEPIGLPAGLNLALAGLLAALPFGLIVLALNDAMRVL